MIRRIAKAAVDAVKGKPAKLRSGRWPKVRKEHLKREPACAVCGGTEKLEVHHIVPFSFDPSQELSAENLITLCEAKTFGITCHLLVGHLSSYRKGANMRVREDAKLLRETILERARKVREAS